MLGGERAMTTLDLDPHLTQISETDAKARVTHKGMAHFAGTGPARKTCRECRFWQFTAYYAVQGAHMGSLKPGKCHKRTSLMRGEEGEAVPYDARACKYFEENFKAPPAKTAGTLS